MNSPRIRFVAMGLVMTVLAALGTISAQEPTGEPRPTEKKSTLGRRVPPNFNKVGVTSEQKEQIYTIRAKYQERILSLQAQIDELKIKELADCEAVLTEAQRKTLESLRAEAKPKGSAVKEKDASKSVGEAKKGE